MKVVLNKIKSWKNGKKWYYGEFLKDYKNNKSKYSKVFIKLFKTKSLNKCKEILKNEFEEGDIRERSRASYLFCNIWGIIGIKEDNKKEYIEWEEYKMPSIRKLKKILIENNYKEIELKGVGFMDGYYMSIIKIVKNDFL